MQGNALAGARRPQGFDKAATPPLFLLAKHQEKIMRLKKAVPISILSTAALIAATPALAQAAGQAGTPTPAPIPVQPTPAPSTTVAQALQASSDHATFVKLAQAANLSATLSGAGPITVFAPDDAAFGQLGAVVQQLLDPANVSSATQIAKYHIVSGSYTTQDLLAQLKEKGGSMTLDTLDGQPLTLALQGESAIELTDAKGGKAFIAKMSDSESNGVIEYINGVLSPNMVAQPAPAAAPAPAAGDATAAPAAGDAASQDAPSGN
jgi:uncharacterized surface protein with fasciclin (FAS1) repeats